jgi:hypothetical protein
MIKNNHFKILQNERNPSIFFITFFKFNKVFINSITKTKILLGTTIYDNYNSFSFKATSVKTFKQYQEYLKTKNGNTNMPYEDILLMIYNLTNQLKYIIECEHMCFAGYNPENIVVFDNNKFAYISSDHLFDINNDENITIIHPFTKYDFFMSPELISIKELPNEIHYKSSYYSLGYVIMYCINSDIDFEKNIEEIFNNLHTKYTKLFGLLKRCLNKSPQKRSIIYF